MLAQILICLVVGIADGDTLTARCPTGQPAHPHEQVRVRVAGIDAPERRQAFGARSKQAMSKLVYRQEVKLDCKKRDQYKRLVCDVYVKSRPDARGYDMDAGLRLVTEGLAWWYEAFSHEQTPAQRREYAAAQAGAQQRRAGLWRDATPVAPWLWRRTRH